MRVIGLFAFPLFVFFFLFTAIGVFLRGSIFPGISIAGIPVGNLSRSEASLLLEQRTQSFLTASVSLFSDRTFLLLPSDIKLRYGIPETVASAFWFGRRNTLLTIPEFLRASLRGVDLPLSYAFDDQALEASLSAVASALDVPVIPPSIIVLDRADPTTGSRIVVEPGEAGQSVDVSSFRREILERFSSLSQSPITIPILPEPASLGFDINLTMARAEKLLGKRAVLSFAEAGEAPVKTWELSDLDLVHFLSFDGGFNREKIASYSASLASSINRPPTNATFRFDGGRVVEFSPEKPGFSLPVGETTEQLQNAFLSLDSSEEKEISVVLPVTVSKPAITTADVNSLGIREKLGEGLSTFNGSIANRKYNISLAASRINGILIPPSETFSFNRWVGDVSSATGFRQAYIIKDGQTILDDGGGVCQVSTTLFRAVLDAGLPVVARRAHSYRVGYYEQNSKAGFDATVFSPTTDFTFLNDTPGHLLIQTSVNTASNLLVIEIYGSSDARTATISNYRMWDVTPPPPDLYQDDPTLPLGTLKQVDWKAWGAKVKFDYRVERDGTPLFEKTFYSNYRPWQSVFLRGTGV